jgi:hypothetical protein
MNDPDQMLKKAYKLEADEVLFHDLNFDSRMKEEIMRSIQPATRRTASGGIFGQKRMRWIYRSATAAAAIIALVIALPMLERPSSSSPPPIESATPLNTTFIEGPSATKWKLPNVKEAQKTYGEGLHLPSYIPDAYVNDSIDAFGTASGDVNKVVFSYMTDNSSYALTIEKRGSLEAVVSDEKIQINGVTGYIHSDEHIGTTLFWAVDDNLYSIVGMLTREETIRVALSIQQ